jgi:hypothetical protein
MQCEIFSNLVFLTQSRKMLTNGKTISWRSAASAIGAVATFGLVVVLVGRAAGTYSAFETETGTLSGGAIAVGLAGASGGSEMPYI